jgi:hypothetical protein
MSVEMREKRLPEREGVLFLIYRNGKVLLEERLHPEKAYFGYTIIPGGKFDKDKEECGVDITEMFLLDNYLQTTITNHLYSVSVYLITDYDGEITNPEGKSKHIWIDINKASEHLLFADSRYNILLAKQQLFGENS